MDELVFCERSQALESTLGVIPSAAGTETGSAASEANSVLSGGLDAVPCVPANETSPGNQL